MQCSHEIKVKKGSAIWRLGRLVIVAVEKISNYGSHQLKYEIDSE